MPEIISGNRVLKKHSLGTPYMNSEKERSLYRSDIMSKDNSIILK